jgi:hypothetical protein
MVAAFRSVRHGALIAALAVAPAWGQGESLWSDLPAMEAEADAAAGARWIVPERARLLRLDRGALAALLAIAPDEGSAPRGLDGVELAIPDVAGGERRYRVVDSPVMAPGLAARYPEWRTFRLIDVADARYGGRGDWTLQGFHALVRTPAGTLYVDPLFAGDSERYQVYYRTDLRRRADQEFRCDVAGEGDSEDPSLAPAAPEVALDLRTYRLAVAATGEYTAFHGGTVALGQAAIVTAVNRVNEVYERDLAIRMVLVASNSSVVYTNAATDPYTNNSGSTMLGQNQTNLTNVIGSANYDIGHVFSTGGGGVAWLSVVCSASNKARGVTGQGAPTGDPFYIDYVAHEMGHQWGANHTFNGTTGACGGANRVSSHAYEPGSGSTIMAYAGICVAEDLQPNSDAYFHRDSLDAIEAFSRSGGGNACKALVATDNLATPVVDAGADHTIPISTPFALTGSATDTDGDALTYCWEQWDLGPAGPAISGNAPIFRSFDPTPEPTRTFPKVADLVDGTPTIGETLPTYGRSLRFRLTTRDNAVPAGDEGYDETVITVSAAAGPFLVTAPNTALTWNGYGPHAVAWNVANTTAAPVSCSSVDIDLSTDGGFTFADSLAVNVANDGGEAVYTGVADSAAARIRVGCHGNVFFDISNADFTIAGADSLLFADSFESSDTARWSETGTEAR